MVGYLVYAFVDRQDDEIVYIGKTTMGKKRLDDHYKPSNRHKHKINNGLQGSPNRYAYVVFAKDIINKEILGIIERGLINELKPLLNERNK